MEVSKELHMDADPGERTAEVSRQTHDTSSQPSTYENRIPALESSYCEMNQRLLWLEEQAAKKKAWYNSVETRLESLESYHRQFTAPVNYNIQKISSDSHPYQQGHRNYQEAFSVEVTQKDLVKENEKLKKEVTELEKRNKELLSKAMGRHKQSENMNDDSRLSAVLGMYNMLKLQDWEKLRQNMTNLTNKDGSIMIKKLFVACETHIQDTIAKVNEVLGITPLDDATIDSDQGVMHYIRNILRHSHYKNQLEFYSKIVTHAGIVPRTEIEKVFTLKCCQVYCLLFLQNPPVKAEWKTEGSTVKHLEHLNWKEAKNWKSPALLWPIMKRGEEVVVKGVVWD
ncbi:uncharacterized protein LOC133217284 [Neopsephotus bourkii]|uniref:uncharacterized protein LOC133217284 n=1 Tax=Neopsephotus bourkii TaxID=309878 RepID=UPI002AA52E6A|nr:uncharacterized protein LOC133217284 [Neopsephotus bourkii]